MRRNFMTSTGNMRYLNCRKLEKNFNMKFARVRKEQMFFVGDFKNILVSYTVYDT